MKPNDDIHQKLWELVYDLLPDDETNEWRKRIDDDPELQQAFDEVQQTASIVARASQVQQPPLQFTKPTSNAKAKRLGESNGSVVSTVFTRLAVLAACCLICATGYVYFKPDSPIRADLLCR